MNYIKTETLHTIALTDDDLFVIMNSIDYYLKTKPDIYPLHKDWYVKTLTELKQVDDSINEQEHTH